MIRSRPTQQIKGKHIVRNDGKHKDNNKNANRNYHNNHGTSSDNGNNVNTNDDKSMGEDQAVTCTTSGNDTQSETGKQT